MEQMKTEKQLVQEIVRGYDKPKRDAFADFINEIVCKNHGLPLETQKKKFFDYVVEKKIPADVLDDFIERATKIMQLAKEQTTV